VSKTESSCVDSNASGAKARKENIHNVYQLKDAIGKGSFATVYEAKLNTPGRVGANGVSIPELVAVKAIDKSKVPREELPLLEGEVEILKKLDHRNCVRLLESFDEPEFLYLVLELVKGGELFDQVISKGFFNEIEAAHATRQIARALAYLQGNEIVHRDVKPENLLFESSNTESEIKLTDFGLAKDISGESSEKPLSDPCGTPGYVAPEILCGLKYGLKVDTWALGVILFILLCGYPPFFAEDQQELFSLIKRGRVKFDSPYWDDVSNDAKHVVIKLLQVNPDKRLSASDLLKEPWVADPDAQNPKIFGEHVVNGIKEVQKRKFKRAVLRVKAMQEFNKLAKFAAALSPNLPEAATLRVEESQEKKEEEEEEKTTLS